MNRFAAVCIVIFAMVLSAVAFAEPLVFGDQKIDLYTI